MPDREASRSHLSMSLVRRFGAHQNTSAGAPVGMSDQHFSRAIILQVPILPMKLSSKLNRATRTSLACLAAVAALAIARHHAPDEASNHPRAHRCDAATRPGG